MNPNDPRYAQAPGQMQNQPIPQSYSPNLQPGQPYFNRPGQPQSPAPYNPTVDTPYDFIFANQKPPKQPLLPGKGNALQMLLLAGGLGIVLIVVIVIVMNLFGGGESMQNVTAIAQHQQELIRVAAQGESFATTETTKNLAFNIDLSIGTNQNQVLAYLNKHKVKLKDKELALKKDAATDQLLTNARATSTFDSTFQKVLADQLDAYLTELQKEYKTTQSTSLKQILSVCYDSGKTLSGQAHGSNITSAP